MKNRTAKITALILCAALVFTTAGVTMNVLADDPTGDGTETKAENTTIQSEAEGVSLAEQSGITKEETVYVLAGADGSTQKIIVSDWIKNAIGADSVKDRSELSDIENVNGEESYTFDGSDTYVWDAKGNDIYYQGNIEKELPVEVAVSYKLDGKAVTPAELAGKSGKVTIRFDYTNKQYDDVKINGKEEKIYVPFAVMTGVVLENDVFTNVTVTNGKLVNDGERTTVMGVAFPGLESNLAVDSEDFEIPDYVEITADVRNFELGMTVTLAANEVFNEIDVENLDSVDELHKSLAELTDAMEQLMDGSSQLYEGLCTLSEKSGELTSGVDALAAGAKTLKDGVGELDNGISQVQAGAGQLSAGLGALAANNDTLNGGARQVFETLLSTANTQLSAAGLSVPAMTIENYAEVLNGVITSLDENAVYEQALAKVTAAVEAQRPYIEEQVGAAIRAEVTTQVTAAVQEEIRMQVTERVQEQVARQVISSATGMDKESYEEAVAVGAVDEQIQAAVQDAIEEQMQSEAVAQLIESNVSEQMASETVQAAIGANVEEQMQSDSVKDMIAANTELQVQKAISDNMASDTVQSQLAAASAGAQSVIALKTSLDSYNSFYLGLQTYTAGVAQAAAGAGDLKEGTDSLRAGNGRLYAGTSELYDGILTLKSAAPALVDGVTQLRDGALQLSDGLTEFDEKGIEKLVETADGDLDGLIARIQATVQVSKNYKSFAGADSGMDGQVKFIYRTEAIEMNK